MGGYLYFTILNHVGLLASNDRPIPIVSFINKQMKGELEWLAPSTSSTVPPRPGSAPGIMAVVQRIIGRLRRIC